MTADDTLDEERPTDRPPPPDEDDPIEVVARMCREWFKDFEVVFERLAVLEANGKSQLEKAEALFSKLSELFENLIIVQGQQRAIAEEQRKTAIRIEAAIVRLDEVRKVSNG